MENEETQKEAIQSALISQSGGIHNLQDVQNYLLLRKLKKDVSIRFLCWLIKFNLIHSSRTFWANDLSNLFDHYSILKNQFLAEKEDNPLSQVDPSTALIIKSDAERTFPWFLKFTQQFGLKIPNTFNPELCVQRILVLLSKDSPKISYTQGFDRFVWISILVCFSFTFNGGLHSEYTEAYSYYVSRELIQLNYVARKIEFFPEIEEHFFLLDSLAAKEEPEIYKLLVKEGHSSLHYALKWELTLFADEHSGEELLYIWDHLIAHIDKFDEYLRYLCIGHLRQVPLPQYEDEMAMVIQQFKNWDTMKIVDDANDLMDLSNEKEIGKFKCMCCWIKLKNIYRNWFSYDRL